MQKKIFAIPIVAVVALFTGYNIYQGQSAKATLSDLALANASTLAKAKSDKVALANASTLAKATLSDLALANVEALATGGGEPGTHNHGPTRNPFLGKKYCKNENQVDCAY